MYLDIDTSILYVKTMKFNSYVLFTHLQVQNHLLGHNLGRFTHNSPDLVHRELVLDICFAPNGVQYVKLDVELSYPWLPCS